MSNFQIKFGGIALDLEEKARSMYNLGIPNDKIVIELTALLGSEAKAKAILNEIINTEKITDTFIGELSKFEVSGTSAEHSGLGCRGSGDFFIHHKIAELIENKDAIIDPLQQDDGGVVQVQDNYITVAVDGMHSRLSHFPFLAGFHVARAAIRDIIVMGGEPKAIFSDIHLANDGDVAKIFDYTAGIAAVSELTETPLIAGSTLRIGGDLVLGDRLSGCAGCIGYGKELTPRKDAQPGDVLIMTEGSGGGTIATTALYNGQANIVKETLNLKIINFGKKLLKSKLIANIHALTDVTNGGLRGDAFELSKTASVRITIFEDAFQNLINQPVLSMLKKLNIDPLGVSIDSLLIILPEKYSEELLKFIRENDLLASIVGKVEEANSAFGEKPSVSLVTTKTSEVKPEQKVEDTQRISTQIIELEPHFREEPYTPIKKVVNIDPNDQKHIRKTVAAAMQVSKNKKDKLKHWLTRGGRV